MPQIQPDPKGGKRLARAGAAENKPRQAAPKAKKHTVQLKRRDAK